MRSYVLWRGVSRNPCVTVAMMLMSVISTDSLASTAYRLAPIETDQVRVGGEIGRRIELTIDGSLMRLDLEEDFLQPFRQKKVIAQSSHQDRYIGLGKLIDATVSFAAHTRDPNVMALKDRMIGELIETQLADGYMGIFQEQYRVTAYWDLHEMVYLIYGLVADYDRFGNKTSLEAARKLADYIIENREPTDKPRLVGKLNTERAFLALYRATDRKEYLDYAVASETLRSWDAPLKGHAYTFMNVCLAQLDLYGIEPNEGLLRQSRRVIDYLRANDGLIVSGTCSRGEGWHNDQVVTGKLGETCATAYLIRLLHTMLCIEGDATYGDMMERAIFNALFAAQLPDGRRIRYFVPLEGQRPIFLFDTYCCPCNFRRIVAELPGMVYYRSSDTGLAVNLYAPSKATIRLRDDVNVTVSQETDYPSWGDVILHVDPPGPTEFPLHLRIPAWCKDARVSVNGLNVTEPVRSGAFLVISRTWRPGDRVELTLPMTWRLVRGRKAQEGRVAVLRGPMLYGLDPRRLVDMNPQLSELDVPANAPATKEESSDARLTFEKTEPLPITAEFVKGLRLDPRSFGDPVKNDAARPDGLACPVRAWSPGRSTQESPDLTVLLTEFPDPSAQATYFLTPDDTPTVQDELVQTPAGPL